MPAITPQLNQSPSVAPFALNDDASAAAEYFTNALLRYSHHDGEKIQPLDPLWDATHSYIQLGCPNSNPPPNLCDHMPSHTRPETAGIADLAAKGHPLQGDDGAILLLRKLIPAPPAPDGHYGRRSGPLFDNLVRIYMPLLARSWMMHAYPADASCHLGVTRTLQMLERFYWWVDMETCYKWWVRPCRKCQARKTSRQTIR